MLSPWHCCCLPHRAASCMTTLGTRMGIAWGSSLSHRSSWLVYLDPVRSC